MRKYIATCFVLLLSAACLASENPGVASAIGWAELVDSGAYAESWDKSAPLFQRQVSKTQWKDALKKVRAPLGGLVSREVAESKPHSSLPGAPDAQYLVVTTATTFQNKATAIETIAVTKSGDDWLVVGYFIK